MDDEKYFLKADNSKKIEEAKPGNEVKYFVDNIKYYASILNDLIAANDKEDFVYFANWWCDIDIPLGDPFANPLPPSLRKVLFLITREKDDLNSNSSQKIPSKIPGAQVCAMIWSQKTQIDWSALPAIVLPKSIFGDPLFAAINTTSVKYIGTCSNTSRGILDSEHRLFGSHHQKFIVIKSKKGLVAYLGSTDFNADRLYSIGSTKAINPHKTLGAPLEDVSVRIEGPAAADVLKTFVDRWKLHPDGNGQPLIGESYNHPAISKGNETVQITHTYGKGYPFKGIAISSAAEVIQKMILNAKEYIYLEDQYLIGTPELQKILHDKLNTNLNVVLIGVMAPLDVVVDLPYIAERRSNFWRQFTSSYLNRVLLFEMTNKSQSTSGAGAYLHAKLIIVDDIIASVGSVNCSNRSWFHDTEISAIIKTENSEIDKKKSLALLLRLERWKRHLQINSSDILRISDGVAKWKTLSSSALVKRWIPEPPSISPKYWVLKIDHERLYDVFLDPR